MNSTSKVIFDGSLTHWRTGNHLDITIVDHKDHDCLELIAYESAFEKEAPRIYINSSKLFPHLDQAEYQKILHGDRVHHHILRHEKLGGGDKAQEAFEKTAIKYLTSRVTVDPQRNNIDHFEVYLSAHLGDTIDEDANAVVAPVYGSLPDGHHHLDIIIEQPNGLVPFPIQRTHITKPAEFYQGIHSVQTSTHGVAAANNEAIRHLHIVQNVVDHLQSLHIADLICSLPRQRWMRAIRRILFQLAYGKVINLLKKYHRKQQYLESCLDQQQKAEQEHHPQDRHFHYSALHYLQPLSRHGQKQSSFEPPPKSNNMSGVGHLNPVIVNHNHHSHGATIENHPSDASTSSPSISIGEVHHHHFMLTTQQDRDQNQSESNQSESNHHLEPWRPMGSRPQSTAPSRTGSRASSRTSSPLHGSLPHLHGLNSPDAHRQRDGGGFFSPQAKISTARPEGDLPRHARDRYNERYHPERLKPPQHASENGSVHQSLPSLSAAAMTLRKDDETSSSAHNHQHHSSSHT